MEEGLDWQRLADLAEMVAVSIAKKWSVVEVDDVKQEILTHALEERHRIEEFADDEELLRKVFWKAGKRYAAKERAHYDLMDDKYFYTPDEVRTALRSFLYTDEEMGEIMGKEDDLIRCRVDDNLMSARQDADLSIKKLNKRYQVLIHKVFICGLPTEGSAEDRAAYRAVDALTAAMNRTLRTRGSRGEDA